MIVTLNFKTPDVLDYALRHLTEDEREEVERFVKRYIEYGECVTLEFDTEKKTATVCRNVKYSW